MKALKFTFCLAVICQSIGYSQEWFLDPNRTFEFNGTVLNVELDPAIWNRKPTNWSTSYCSPCSGPSFGADRGGKKSEAQTYWEQNVSLGVVDGRNCLLLTATYDQHTESCSDCPNNFALPCTLEVGSCKTFDYKSGMIETTATPNPGGFGDYGYGKFEICCKMPSGEGVFPAFWLFGSDTSQCNTIPIPNEIDVFEHHGGPLTNDIAELNYRYYNYCNDPFFNYNDPCDPLDPPNGPNDQISGFSWHSGVDLSQGFHVYSVEWTADHMIWKIDGVNRRIINRNTYFDIFPCQKMSVIANLAISNGTTALFPCSLAIDYIHFYTQSKCKSYVVCDYDDESPSSSFHQLEGYSIDLALGDDIYPLISDFNGINGLDIHASETYWTPGWPLIGSNRDYSCDLNVTTSYNVQAEDRIIMHDGFLADANLFTNANDLFIAQIIPCSSHSPQPFDNRVQVVKDIEVENGVSIYPNPAIGDITIDLKDIKSYNGCSVYNTLGSELFRINFNDKQSIYKIKLDEQPKGIYVFKLYKESGIELRKVVID